MSKTKFGYKDINSSDKPTMVNNIFTSVSNKYDIMNDLMSFGLHRIWKTQFIRMCDVAAVKNVLDVACGTGDICCKIIQHNPLIELTCLDPNEEMIEICKQKLINKGYTKTNFHIKGIEEYNPKNKKYDLITIAFGFRNFTNHKKALGNIYNTLTPGGKLMILDFKIPRNNISSKLFKTYTLDIIPKLGKLIANDEDSYRYLGESIQTYFSPDEINDMLSEAGFIKTKIINLLEDVASIHIGYKA
tara:strand:+ start:9042 stop:9776 length:735 start_codon:yes stop_codon:yes gene_type:complete